MRFPTVLRTVLTRKPTLVAALGVGAVGIVGGGALALQADGSQAAATSAKPAPSCAPSKAKGHEHHVAVGKVTAVSAGSITIQGVGGKSQTFAISARTKVRGPGKTSLDYGAVKVGDYVAVAKGGKPKGSATPAPGGASTATATGIRDYGAHPPKAKPHPQIKPKPCPSP
jgi:hypothetical protein